MNQFKNIRPIMRNLLILFLVVFATNMVTGQELVRSTLGASGASSELVDGENTYIVQQSVGQSSVTGTYQNGSYGVRQGFIQPPIVVGDVSADSTINAVVFPNPFESVITISFNEELKKPLSIIIFDMLGRVIHQEERPAERSVVLELDSLSTAQYVLLITSGDKQFKANILKN